MIDPVADLIAIFALLITIIGWLYNRESQKNLADKQTADNAASQTKLEQTRQDFALKLQEIQQISTTRSTDLREVNDWWKEAFDLSNQLANRAESHQGLDENSRLYGLLRRWRNNYFRRIAIASQMDQARFGGENVYDNDDLNDWFASKAIPRKLTSLVSAMSELVGDFAMEAECPGVFELHTLHDQFEKLFTGGTAVIQEVETNLFKTN